MLLRFSRGLRSLTLGLPLLLLGYGPPVVSGSVPSGVAEREASAAEDPDPPSGEIMDMWRELRAWRPEAGAGAAVSGLTLARDAAEFHLDEGTLTLLEIRGSTAAAVFEGVGRVRLDVPVAVERDHLMRHLEWDAPEVTVERLVFFFADSTATELRSVADFQPTQLSRSARDATRDAIEGVVGEDEGAISLSVVRTFLNEEPTELFWAHIFPRRGDDLYFRFDALSPEEVAFGRHAGRGDGFETLSLFHRRDAYDVDGTLVTPHPEWMTRSANALHYVGRLDLGDRGDIGIEMEVSLVPNVPGGSWISASLYHGLDIDSLRWGDGSPVVYDRSSDEISVLWLRLPEDATEGGLLSLEAWYGGDILSRTRDGFDYVRTTSAWLPRFGASEATYDFTFRTREDWPVMSVGRRVSRTVDPTDDRIVVSRWVTDKPSAQVTFSVGDFEEYEFPGVTTRPVRLHVAEDFHRRFRDLTSQAADATRGRVNIMMQADPEVQVHRDIEASLRFFTDVYGPLDFEEYNVAEIPGSHGQAFPGMINLSWQTYAFTSPEGFDEIFRAHEVAHQWWGIGVRPETYHDVWLQEGLSEFSALWYIHRVRGNPARYLARLEDLKERILERRDESGPIWLGPRVGVGRDQGLDYQVTVYYKGAWVLHMLRNLLIDHDTGSEEVFEGLMKEAYSRFADGAVSTEAFRSLVEERSGVDMRWFFDQWVYGTDIPTYRFASTTEEAADGTTTMKLRVRQEDVPESFLMVVPIEFDFAGEGSAVVPMLVEGPETMLEFPVPRAPDGVTFNVSESVLAVVETERW